MRLKALLFFLLVVIHLISILPMEQPMIMADELGYLGNARSLAGQAHLPDLAGARFYHFGYSLLLVPAFWLFANPLTAYKAALVINALLMSSLFLALCGLVESLGWVSKRAAIWIAFTCSLYPPIVLYSDFAWAENAFIPAYALTLLLLARYLRSRTLADAILFGAMAGLLYAIHPRALPVVLLAGFYLLLLAVLRSVGRRQALLGAAAAALVFALTRIGNQHLEGLGWAGVGEFSALKLGSRLLPGDQWLSLILRAAGQLFYMAVSTYGLFLLGLGITVVYLWRRLAAGHWRRRLADPQVGMLIFLLLSGIGILLGSTTLKVYSLFGRETIRAANFIFGRYNEAFAIVMTALGLAWLWRSRLDRQRRSRQGLAVAAGLLVLTLLIMWQVRIAAATEPGSPWMIEATNIAGIYPLVDLFGMPRLFLASLVAISVLVLLSMSFRHSLGGSLALLAVLFGATTIYTERVNLVPARKALADRLSFIPDLRRLGPPATLDYDFAFRDYRVFYGAQFRLPETVFHRFHSRQGEEPTSEVVLSGKGWSQSRALDARVLVAAAAGDTAVWVLPGEIRQRLPAPSLVGVNIGVEPGAGVEEWGFYPPEKLSGATVRWTEGAAVLRLPWGADAPPANLMVDLATPVTTGTRLRITANRAELWNGWIPETWSRSFSLAEVPRDNFLTLELESDTVNPSRDIPGATDDRELGVQVRAIYLMPESEASGSSYLDKTLGHEPIRGVGESGFHATETLDRQPVRWTNGAATLEVPLDPQSLPRWLEIEVAAPGRSGVRLLVLANGVELWQSPVSEQGLSTRLDLDKVPRGDSLQIELRSESFIPAQTVPGSTDSRRLGVLVKGLRLTGTRR